MLPVFLKQVPGTGRPWNQLSLEPGVPGTIGSWHQMGTGIKTKKAKNRALNNSKYSKQV